MYRVDVVDIRTILTGVTVLKLDCEGAEIQILLSMAEDEWQAVRILLVEYSLVEERRKHNTIAKMRFKTVLCKLERAGFSHMWFNDRDVFYTSRWEPKHFRHGVDFVFAAYRGSPLNPGVADATKWKEFAHAEGDDAQKEFEKRQARSRKPRHALSRRSRPAA